MNCSRRRCAVEVLLGGSRITRINVAATAAAR
jgi:hypothetical protein